MSGPRRPRGRRAPLLVAGVAVAAGALAALVHWTTSSPLPAPAPTVPVVTRDEPGGKIRGRPDASVTIEIFSDFLCSHCAAFALETEPAIVKEFVEPGVVRLVYRQFPVVAPLSEFLAEASECAADQRRFWAFHDVVMRQTARGALRTAADVEAAAREAALDLDALAACRPQPAIRARVDADVQEGMRRGVRATPTLFVNGQMLVGAQPIEVIRAAIDAAGGR